MWWNVTVTELVRTTVTELRKHAAGVVEPLRGDGRGWALVAIACGWLLILGTRITIPVLLPGIKTTFAIDNTTAGFVVTVIWGVYALSQFPAGLLAERIGDRKVLVLSLAVVTVSIVALGLAPFFSLFLVMAAMLGIGNGLFGTTRGTILSALYPDNASTAIGTILAVGSLGAAGLPVLAGAMVSRYGWRLTLASAVPLLGVATVLAWRVVPRTSRVAEAESVRHRLRGILSAVSNRPVVLGVGAKTVRVFVYQGLTAFLPTYLIATKGVDELTASVLLSLLFVSGALAQAGGGRVVSRYGSRSVLVVFAAVSAGPVFALPLLSNVFAIAAVVVVSGVQLGIAPVTNTYIIDAIPEANRNSAWGLLRTIYFLVASTGSVFVGALADAGYFDGAFFILGGLLLVVAFAFTFLPNVSDE